MARLDYAIVGGGMSGLYTAWRLLCDRGEADGDPPSVAIFEMGDRTGGRLLTWLPDGPDGGLRAELGGMRFFEQQAMVWGLLERLGFGTEDRTQFWVSGPKLRRLMRGVSAFLDDPNPTARYNLPPDEQGMAPDALVGQLTNTVLQAPENWTVIEERLGGKLPADREDWDAVKPYLSWRGRPLWDLGFWNLLSDVYSAETYQYVCDAFGYYSLAGNWNAAEAFQFMYLDFSSNPNYQTLRRGYGALPDALAAAVEKAGCKINLNTRLVRFDALDGGGSALTLAGPTGESTIEADNLVLGLPRRSLELLAPSADFDLQGDPALKRLVQSVKPLPAFKLFMLYEERWWERLGIQHGRSVCDLPIRQTYYFAPQPWPWEDGDPLPSHGLLMASYDDARAVDYWQGLVPARDPKELKKGRAELHKAARALTGAAAKGSEPPPHLHLATDEMIRHATAQLALLHDIPESDIPEPRVGAFADWGLDPFGGGWNFWDVQVDVKSAMERIKRPLGPNRNVFVVGDAYSGDQGWVEGALTATEVALERHLHLDRPDWIPPDYYLGW